MTTLKRGQGAVDALDRFLLPEPKPVRQPKQTPHAIPARQGISVIMRPIPGVSSKKGFPNNEPFTFQVPPMDVFGADGDFPHNDQVTVGAGEVSSPGSGPNLQTISWTTVFLDWQPEWSSLKKDGWTPDPQRFIARLRTIKDEGKPFHLLANQAVLRDRYDVDWPATLRSVHWELRAGEDDAYYVTVSFKEFRSSSIQEFLVGATQHHALPHTVQIKGIADDENTLAKLALKYYGDPSKFPVIVAANGLTRMRNRPGVKLTLSDVGRNTLTVPVARSNKLPSGQSR